MAPPATLTKVVQLSRQILIGRTVQRWIYKFITKYFRTLLTSSKERIPNNHPTVIKYKTLKDIDQNKLENIPSNLNFNHASGHATLLPAGRTLKFIALFLTNEVYNNEYHIYERDIDFDLDRDPTTNLSYKFKSRHNYPSTEG